ncbi:hypothetical protein [Streptomyces zaomyceticus]|uniref:hypothetical protein n=1 Tax=Streptomyces zaomyceticus TaxID=68286 RepID=UPI0037B8B20D
MIHGSGAVKQGADSGRSGGLDLSDGGGVGYGDGRSAEDGSASQRGDEEQGTHVHVELRLL